MKNSIRIALEKEFDLTLATPTEEKKDPARADKAIEDAFQRVRGFLRRFDPNGVWQKNNIEYGFCRNLLGGRRLWVFMAAGSMVVALWRSAASHAGLFNPAVMVSFLSLACAGHIGWRSFGVFI